MADKGRAEGAVEFWRCSRCGTRNPSAGYVTTCLGCGASRPVKSVEGPRSDARIIIREPRGRYLGGASWAYAVLVLAVLILIHWVGDTFWFVTPLLFMPRWLFLVPLLILAGASGVRRCRSHWVLQATTGVIVAWPLMGATFAVQQLWERAPTGERVRIATLNLGIAPLDHDVVRRWVVREKLDVICFQEVGPDPERSRLLVPEGWHLSRRGSIASRWAVVGTFPEYAARWEEGRFYTSYLERVRLRSAGGRDFVVASVHLPTVREGIETFLRNGTTAAILRDTSWWGREMARVMAALAESNGAPMLVGGDFNMPPDDSTMAALRATFRSAFDEAGWGYGYTRPARFPWVRIDHILAGPDWSVTSCRVGPNVGSDHLPLRAELAIPDSTPRADAGR